LRIFRFGILAFFCAAREPGLLARGLEHGAAAQKNSAAAEHKPDLQKIFQRGQAALEQGLLKDAEQDFHGIIAVEPHSAGAYANLGVVYMREKQWKPALAMLPVSTLEPLESQESNDLNFLYVLAISAWKSKQPHLEQRALARLVEIGGNSPEFHLLIGKAHLNREEYDDAIRELELAAQASPRLPFVHFNLGLAHMKKLEFDEARSEFLKHSAIEPDVPYNYDQLGIIEANQQHARQAEQYFKQALRLDPDLASSRYQLARVYQSEG
jgi:tetratricopeptide (TPR) repeat protein